MIDFNYDMKTELYFGKGKAKLTGDILHTKNAKKVLIIIGQSSVKKSGLLDVVTSSLDKNKIEYLILEGVRPNPNLEVVYKGLEMARLFRPDFLLPIGGGSVIDTAKLISVGYYYDGDCFDFNRYLAKPTRGLPIGVVLTISAAGSEMSTSCVIQDDKTLNKAGFNSDLVRPVFAIEDPELTFSVNPAQTGYGIVDIIMHTLERYLSPSSDNEIADGLAEGLLKTIIKAGRIVIENPTDYQARATLMLASSLSHNGITSIGKKYSMPVHQLEHALSGVYPHVAHAAGLALLFPAWAEEYLQYDIDKFDQLAKNVFGSHLPDKLANAKKGVTILEEYFGFLNMPKSYKDLNIENVDVELLVKKFSNDGTRIVGHHTKPIDQETARKIYKSCF
ncbi:MAG: iron-containing alcohol dehydrogenase [Bacilli bacterium]|nr:iron-containing alcohol dehydrogenase [Bacilli bacterium]MDD3069012.1 iron-containing alcohol dehydrogenase [Bacilli bacterium]HKM10029.1 iron-containing alcohol dehydrogenase [Bacilli bacterium]